MCVESAMENYLLGLTNFMLLLLAGKKYGAALK
jgi:hypothetical protein